MDLLRAEQFRRWILAILLVIDTFSIGLLTLLVIKIPGFLKIPGFEFRDTSDKGYLIHFTLSSTCCCLLGQSHAVMHLLRSEQFRQWILAILLGIASFSIALLTLLGLKKLGFEFTDSEEKGFLTVFTLCTICNYFYLGQPLKENDSSERISEEHISSEGSSEKNILINNTYADLLDISNKAHKRRLSYPLQQSKRLKLAFFKSLKEDSNRIHSSSRLDDFRNMADQNKSTRMKDLNSSCDEAISNDFIKKEDQGEFTNLKGAVSSDLKKNSDPDKRARLKDGGSKSFQKDFKMEEEQKEFTNLKPLNTNCSERIGIDFEVKEDQNEPTNLKPHCSEDFEIGFEVKEEQNEPTNSKHSKPKCNEDIENDFEVKKDQNKSIQIEMHSKSLEEVNAILCKSITNINDAMGLLELLKQTKIAGIHDNSKVNKKTSYSSKLNIASEPCRDLNSLSKAEFQQNSVTEFLSLVNTSNDNPSYPSSENQNSVIDGDAGYFAKEYPERLDDISAPEGSGSAVVSLQRSSRRTCNVGTANFTDMETALKRLLGPVFISENSSDIPDASHHTSNKIASGVILDPSRLVQELKQRYDNDLETSSSGKRPDSATKSSVELIENISHHPEVEIELMDFASESKMKRRFKDNYLQHGSLDSTEVHKTPAGIMSKQSIGKQRGYHSPKLIRPTADSSRSNVTISGGGLGSTNCEQFDNLASSSAVNEAVSGSSKRISFVKSEGDNPDYLRTGNETAIYIASESREVRATEKHLSSIFCGSSETNKSTFYISAEEINRSVSKNSVTSILESRDALSRQGYGLPFWTKIRNSFRFRSGSKCRAKDKE